MNDLMAYLNFLTKFISLLVAILCENCKLVGISICCFWKLVLGWEEGNSTGFKVLAIGNLKCTKDLYQSDLQGKILLLLLLLLSGPLGKAKKRLMIQFFSLLSAHLSNVP